MYARMVSIFSISLVLIFHTPTTHAMQKHEKAKTCYLQHLVKAFKIAKSQQEVSEAETQLNAALVWANEHGTMVKELTDTNLDGNTALHEAVKLNYYKPVIMLLPHYNANKIYNIYKSQNNLYLTPISIAISNLNKLYKSTPKSEREAFYKNTSLRWAHIIIHELQTAYKEAMWLAATIQKEPEAAQLVAKTTQEEDLVAAISDEEMTAWFIANSLSSTLYSYERKITCQEK